MKGVPLLNKMLILVKYILSRNRKYNYEVISYNTYNPTVLVIHVRKGISLMLEYAALYVLVFMIHFS